MDFSQALKVIKGGGRVQRPHWRTIGKDWIVSLHVPGCGEATDHPFFIKDGVGGRVVWAPTPGDLLAGDWEEVTA